MIIFTTASKRPIRKVWTQLFDHFFDHYKNLESFHTFSVIRTVGTGSKLMAEMTCTGVVWGTAKNTKLRSPVNSWYEEVHFLKKENGRWNITGNAGGESEPILPLERHRTRFSERRFFSSDRDCGDHTRSLKRTGK